MGCRKNGVWQTFAAGSGGKIVAPLPRSAIALQIYE
jgi:hypothetical protein